MKIQDPNIELVEFVAKSLGKLGEEFVYVGGCAAGLLITDIARAAIRPTNDVDVIVEVAGLPEYYVISDGLREMGFKEDPELTCRWRIDGVKVDVMPTSEAILGFVNKWYPEALATASDYRTPNGIRIRLISGPLLLATKLEAFYGRGGGDYQGSHDLEDIISVLDGRSELNEEVAKAPQPVRDYLRSEFEDLLSDQSFVNSVVYHLRPEDNQQRSEIVIQRMRQIAGL